MSFPDEDLPKNSRSHEIGCDLSQLSVDELDNRIVLLKQEIDRIEMARAEKSASRSAAESFFRR